MTISAEELREKVYTELKNIGFSFNMDGEIIPPEFNKEMIRELHEPAREEKLQQAQEWIRDKIPEYKRYFASGSDISPKEIKPQLINVELDWHKDLFRLARYYWSLPYSFGFGRRLRYLLLDESNGKLIGIFGLQSPPISFPARDELFNYPEGRKAELVNQMMDIFTLGALPPYARLLGGKLVAYAVVANEVREDYVAKYSGKRTEMKERIIPANLVALTTTSAFGRSSIYNRLRYEGINIAESIGYTKGYGNFHLQRVYPLLKEYLSDNDVSVEGGYGKGPKRSWQLINTALGKIGINNDLLKHGIKREAFLFRLINNLEEYLEGQTDIPVYRDLPFDDLSAFWKDRWLSGRYQRVDSWHQWESRKTFEDLLID